MICSFCGGNVVWRGPITNLTYTQCQNCGGWNCQEVEKESLSDGEEEFEELPDRSES